MIRVDVDLFNHTAQSQLNDTPIIPGRTAAAALPSVHPLTAIGVLIGNENAAAKFEQILLLREELIVRQNRDAADTCGRQIDKTCRR
jgi:hypothetical protein